MWQQTNCFAHSSCSNQSQVSWLKTAFGPPNSSWVISTCVTLSDSSLFSEQVRPIRLDIYIGWYTSSAHPIPPPNTKLTKNQPLT